LYNTVEVGASVFVTSFRRVFAVLYNARMTVSLARQAERTIKKRPDYVHQVERCLRAANMRREGVPTREIADALGYKSTSGANHAVRFGLELLQVAEPAETMRMIQSNRLERLINVLWAQAESGDLDAIDRVVKLMQEQSKLYGLYAPIKIDMDAEIRAMAEQFGVPYDEARKLASGVVKALPSGRVA
jgi:hypothetical protein